MLGAALDVAAEAEIVTVELLGFFDMALIQKQCREGVARWMHPGPGLGVGQIVVELDGLAQMPVGLVVLPLMVGELAIEQSRADRQGGACRVAQEAAIGRDPRTWRWKRSRSSPASAKWPSVACATPLA